MKRITSFSVDHEKLERGIYVSRTDDDIITYDIRMTKPNVEATISSKGAHTLEHLGATILRNGKYQDKIIYFGPMGCLTGFYLIVRDLDLAVVTELVKEMMMQISEWQGDIPGALPQECGNYQYMDLADAKAKAKSFCESPWEHQYHYLGE